MDAREMQPVHRRMLLVTLLVLSAAGPSAAQTSGTIGVGAGVTTVRPRSPELSTTPRLRPILRRMPASGWGLALALNWFDADVDASAIGTAEPLGRLSIRPLMAGIGYTAVRGRLSLTPSLVAGPALNTLSIDERWRGGVTVGGSSLERRLGTLSLAVRPGVTATYAIAPHLAVTGSGGYLFNRPSLTLREGEHERRVRWNTDGLLLGAGVLVTF